MPDNKDAEIARIINHVLLMGRGVYDTPLGMTNAIISALRFAGYEIRKDK